VILLARSVKRLLLPSWHRSIVPLIMSLACLRFTLLIFLDTQHHCLKPTEDSCMLYEKFSKFGQNSWNCVRCVSACLIFLKPFSNWSQVISRAVEPSNNITGEEVIVSLFRNGHIWQRRIFFVCKSSVCNSALCFTSYALTHSGQTSVLV